MIERMVDLAADRLGIDPAELRRRNLIPPDAMPFKTGLTFTYDSGEFAKNMDMALELADADGFPARRREARAARQAARPRHLQHDRARRARRASRAPRSGSIASGTVTLSPARSTRARATRPCSSRSSATVSASTRRHPISPGRHRPGVLRRRHRRLALGDARRLGGRCGGRTR